MIKIRNIDTLNDYLENQRKKYSECGVVQAVIIDKSTEYEYTSLMKMIILMHSTTSS